MRVAAYAKETAPMSKTFDILRPEPGPAAGAGVRRLHHPHPDPGAGHPRRHGRQGPAGHRPDRHRQDRGLRPADPAPPGRQPQSRPCRAPRACLILSPTRELASQIAESFKTYGKHLGFTRRRGLRRREVRRRRNAPCKPGLDVLVATPGRLLDHMQQKTLDLSSTEIFVLDEADQMLDLGFVKPIRQIVSRIPAKRQNLFFSATMPTEIGKLAGELLKDPVKVSVTPQATTVERISQSVIHIEQGRKRALLTEMFADRQLHPLPGLHQDQARRRQGRGLSGSRRRRGRRHPRQQEPAPARAHPGRLQGRQAARPGRHRHRRARHRRGRRLARAELRAALSCRKPMSTASAVRPAPAPTARPSASSPATR